jgi:hypothetical protein
MIRPSSECALQHGLRKVYVCCVMHSRVERDRSKDDRLSRTVTVLTKRGFSEQAAEIDPSG